MFSLIAAIISPFAGKLGDKVNPVYIIRGSYFIMVISMAILRFSEGLVPVFISLGIMALSMTFFWPVIQAAVGKESQEGKESKAVSRFSMCWSIGKSIGFLLSGYCFSNLGVNNSLSLLVFLCGFNVLIYPYSTPEEAVSITKMQSEERQCGVAEGEMSQLTSIDIELDTEELERPSSETTNPRQRSNEFEEDTNTHHLLVSSDIPPRPLSVRQHSFSSTRSAHSSFSQSSFVELSGTKIPRDPLLRFNNNLGLPLAWIFNFSVYGIANTISSLYVKVIMAYDIEIPGLVNKDSFLGVWNFFFYLSQTTCFAAGSKFVQFWEYNRKFLYFVEGLQAMCLFLLGVVHQPHTLLGLALVMGTGTGLSEIASLTYSLRASDDEKGKFAGLNETIIHAGSFLFPIALGFVSDVSFFVPYVILASVVILSVIVQETVYRLREKGARHTYLEVPFIALSSEAGELHADPKEMSNTELAEAIRRMLDQHNATERHSQDEHPRNFAEGSVSDSTSEDTDSTEMQDS